MQTSNMLEQPRIRRYSPKGSKNMSGAVNQQARQSQKDCQAPETKTTQKEEVLLNTPKHKSMIVGVVVGDSWIAKNHDSSNYSISFQHSGKQADYLKWKKDRFSNLGLPVSKIYDVSKNGFIAYRFNVQLGEASKYWRHQFYPNGNKTISRHLLNMLDAEGLSIWFMDDGSKTLHKSGGRAEICLHTEAYSVAEQKIIRNYLKTVWDVPTGLRTRNKNGKRYYYLSILSEGKKRFMDIITPYACESMLWKFDYESRCSKGHLHKEMVV